MRTFFYNAFKHWQTTLGGIATSALVALAHPADDAGTGWKLIALIAPLVLGMMAKDPGATK